MVVDFQGIYNQIVNLSKAFLLFQKRSQGTFKVSVIPGTPKDMGPPYGKRDPYYSHTIPIPLGIRKWEWYGGKSH